MWNRITTGIIIHIRIDIHVGIKIHLHINFISQSNAYEMKPALNTNVTTNNYSKVSISRSLEEEGGSS